MSLRHMFHRKGPSVGRLARQALSSTDEGYRLLARQFDYTPYRTPGWALDETERALATLGPFQRGLDVCCGTGAGVRMLKRVCTDEVVGADRVPAMLAQAQRNIGPHEPGAPVRFEVQDALALPYRAQFDIVTCFGALGHIEEHDADTFLRSLFGTLAPGGRFVFITHEPPPPSSRAYWYAKTFNAAMRLRNALIQPAFVMYYLGFMWPEVRTRLAAAGFENAHVVSAFGNAEVPQLLVSAERPR